MARIIIIFLLIAQFHGMSYAQNESVVTESAEIKDSIEAIISIEKFVGSILAKAVFINNSLDSVSYVYKFLAKKSGPSGKTSTNQSDKFFAGPGEEKVLSTVSINLEYNDKCDFELQIIDNDKELIRKILTYPK